MQMVQGRSIALSKASMEDPDKKQTLLDILAFLSTNEGQAALLEVFSGLSSVKSAQANLREEYWDVQNCIENGQIFFAGRIGNDQHNPILKAYLEGKLTLEQVLEQTDAMVKESYADREPEEPVGTAAEEFTVLETSIFIADAMRFATGAEIALIPHRTYYTGNLAKFYEGDVTMMYPFYLRGLVAWVNLTTYDITCSYLKKLL